MFLSDFISEHRLSFHVQPIEGILHKVTISQGSKSISTKVGLTPGREFSGVAFLKVMQDSFRKLHTTSAEAVLETLSGNENALKEFAAIRDDFVGLVGMPAYLDFLRDAREPKSVNGAVAEAREDGVRAK